MADHWWAHEVATAVSRGDALVALGVDADTAQLAVSWYDRATDLDSTGWTPHACHAWTSKGHLLHTVIRSYAAAIDCFIWARALEPTNGALCHQLGCALSCAGRHFDAAAAHHEAAAVYASTVAPAEHIAEQFYLAANALQLCSDPDAAIQAYNSALAVMPSHRKAMMAKVRVSANSCWAAAASQRVSKPQPLESPYHQVRLPGDATNALHAVHCMHWLDAEQCNNIIKVAEDHCKGAWTSTRHEHHSTLDVEVSQLPELRDWAATETYRTLLPTLGSLYQLEASRLRLRELFIVKYEAGRLGGQQKLGAHRDGFEFSFSVLLSEPSSFDGGGTHLVALDAVIRPQSVGDVFMHCGQMLHAGAEITRGTRYILVGFVAVVEPSVAGRVEAQSTNVIESSDDDPVDVIAEDQELLARYWSALQSDV